MDRFIGKRFAAFIITAGLLTVGILEADPTVFASYANVLGLVYSVYLGGQSATDWKAAQQT